MNALHITIWDDDADRIAEADRRMRRASRDLGIDVFIDSQSEPPLLARMNFTGKTPVFEINGLYWALHANVVPSAESCTRLLKHIINGGQDF